MTLAVSEASASLLCAAALVAAVVLRFTGRMAPGRILHAALVLVLIGLAAVGIAPRSSGWLAPPAVNVVLLDLSRASVIDEREALRRAAWSAGDESDADRVLVVAFGASARVLYDGPGHELPDTLAFDGAGDERFRRGADLERALDVAGRALGDDVTARLALVTTGPPGGDAATWATTVPFPCESIVVRAPGVPPVESVGLRFVTSPLTLTAGATPSVELEVTPRVGTARRFRVVLEGGGSLEVAATPASGKVRVVLTAGPVPPGASRLAARLEGVEGWDADPSDDSATLPVHVRGGPVRVKVMGDRAEALALLVRSGSVVAEPLSLDAAPAEIRAAEVVWIDDVPADRLAALGPVLRELVAGGGGLFLSGADAAFGAGGWEGTEVDALSPLKSRPGNRGMVVTVALDRSGSMDRDGRFRAACDATIALHAGLRAGDELRLLAFGVDVEESRWPGGVPGDGLEAHLRRLVASGGTRLAGVLDRAVAEPAPEDRDSVVLVLTDAQDAQSLTPANVRRWSKAAAAGRHAVHVLWFDRDETLRPSLTPLAASGSLVEIDDFGALHRPFLEAARRRLRLEPARVRRADGTTAEVPRVLRTRLDPAATVLASVDATTAAVATVARGAGRCGAAPLDLLGGGAEVVFGDRAGLATFLAGLAVTDAGGDETVAVEPFAGGWRFRVTGWSGGDVPELRIDGTRHGLREISPGVWVTDRLVVPPEGGVATISGGGRTVRRVTPAASGDTRVADPEGRDPLADRLRALAPPSRSGGAALWALLAFAALAVDIVLRAGRR